VSVVGVGTDLVEIARLESALARFGERFAARILGGPELAEWRAARGSARLLAKRFAAKEAAAKALGTGFRDGIRLCDIQVRHDELGKPYLDLLGGAGRRAAAMGVTGSQLSLSDERLYALAFVVLIKD